MYPGVDDLAMRMKDQGTDCYMFKRDASRCFRWIPWDPFDYSLFVYCWRGLFYFDKVLAMRHRIAPFICQRVTGALAHIYRKPGYFLLNYVDDFVGAEKADIASDAYIRLGEVLSQAGLPENAGKATPPSQVIEFLGVTFNALEGTMEVSLHRLDEIHELLDLWRDKEEMSRKSLESLIGKLQFVVACMWPGCVFISRMLNTLREMPRTGRFPITYQMRMDLEWWRAFMVTYNGVSVAWMDQWTEPDWVVSCDASGVGVGGYLTGMEFFHIRIPPQWKGVNIAYMEMWGVIMCLRAWGVKLSRKRVVMNCDNMAVVSVLTHGRSKDLFLQGGMCEVAYLLAISGCELLMNFVNSKANEITDWLSRWGDPQARQAFLCFKWGRSLRRHLPKEPVFKFEHNW